MNFIEFTPPKVKASKLEKSLYISCAVLLFFYWVFFLYLFPSLPEEVPIHTSSFSDGTDSYGPRWAFFILPMIATIMGLVTFGTRFAVRMMNFPVKVTEANAGMLIKLSRNMLAQLALSVIAMLFAIFIDFSFVMLERSVQGFWFVYVVIVGWIFGMMGYYIVLMLKKERHQ